MSLQTKIKVINIYSLCSNFNTWYNMQRWEVVAYPLQGILLMDVATATPSPGEHGDSATDLPSKRLAIANVLGPTNMVCSATLCSCFCGRVGSSSLHTMAVKVSSRWRWQKVRQSRSQLCCSHRGAARGAGVAWAHNLLSRRWYILHYHRSTLLLPLEERLLLIVVEWKREVK